MALTSAILYISLFVSLFFEIFLLITYFEVKSEIEFEREHGGKNIKDFKSVTIVVPCHNEESTVVGTINSILALDYPKDMLRLMVVDDGSTDKTYEIVSKTFATNNQIELFKKENGGKHSALNFALTKIDSELVGCLDADSFVEPSALKRIVQFFEDKKIMAVTPSIRIHDPKNPLQYMQKVEYGWGIFLRRLLSSINALYVTPGPFSIFRTKVFKELGGYKHAHHTEDMEMALRMQKNGYRIVNAHSAHVYTVGPDKIKKLYKQRVRWVYGFLNNVFDYKEMFFNKKYGNIGMFILPIATFSIFSTIYAFGNLLWSFGSKVPEYMAKYQAVGFNFGMPNFSGINWFAVNLNTSFWITVVTLSLTLVILTISLKVSEGKVRFGRGVFYYLTLYAFIVPFWLIKATYSSIVRKNISWR